MSRGIMLAGARETVHFPCAKCAREVRGWQVEGYVIVCVCGEQYVVLEHPLWGWCAKKEGRGGNA